MTQISLIKSADSYQGTQKLLYPLKSQLKEKLKQVKKIVIKINFVTTENELATTPFSTVKSFIDFIKPFYQGKIVIAEEASLGNTQKGFEQYGFKNLADNDPQIEVFDSAKDEVKKIEVKYFNKTLTLPIAKIYLDSPFTVSITRAKTHDTVVVTLGIKNLLVGAIQGGIPQREKIHQGKKINWIMAEMTKFLYPDFVIIDGVVGMQDNGPVDGIPKKANWLVASFDPLAADSLATYLMGFNIDDVGYLNLIKKTRGGKLYPHDKEQITIIGPDPATLVSPFQPHSTFAYQRRWKE